LEIFSYGFMQNALIAAVLSSIICGVVGAYVVSARLVFLSGGVSHASFGGVGLAYLLGFNPVVGALFFALLGAGGISLAREKGISEDTAAGALWPVGMGLGALFIGLSAGYAPDLFSYLFGNILTVSNGDLWLLLGVTLVTCVLIFSFRRQLFLFCYDAEYAKTRGIRTGWVSLLLFALIAVTSVALIKVVGIILAVAMLAIPAGIARLFSSSLRQMMLWAIITAALTAICGLVISYYLDIASGAAIVVLIALVFLAAVVFKNIKYKN
jgi:zinc transport system permease protein